MYVYTTTYTYWCIQALHITTPIAYLHYRVINSNCILYFSLTGTKKQRFCKTQPFLFRIYVDILIFWCLSMARWKKSCLSGLCQNSVNSPPCKEWAPRQPFRHIRTPQTFRDTIQIPPIHPPDTIQALIDINRNKLTSTDTPQLSRPSQVLFEDG